MPESSEQAPQGQRRANWVALRTLRQRPRAVGFTDDGQTVFEVKSVRLVLRGDAPYFNRLVRCSKCEREVVGSEVTTTDDLDRTPFPVICRDCVRSSTSTAAWQRDERRDAPARLRAPEPVPSVVTSTVEQAAERPASPPQAAAPERLDAFDRQLKEMAAQLRELAERTEDRPDDDATLAAVRGAVGEGLNQARAEMTAASEASARRLDALEGQMRQGVDRLLALVDAQRTEASTVGASLAGIRSELQRVTESQAELTAAQQAVEGRVSAVAARQSEQDFAAPVVGALRQRVDDLQAEVRSLVEAEGTALRASVEEGLADARLEATARDQQLQRGMSRLSAMVEALRSELESSIDGAVRFEMETAKKAQEELAEAQGHLERRLDGLDQRVRDALERLYDRVEPATHPVAAPLSNGESLLDELERKLVDAQRRLTERAGTEAN